MVKYNTERRRITLGYVPIRRDFFPPAAAIGIKDEVYNRFKSITDKLGDIDLIDIDDIVDGGILWHLDDVQKVVDKFTAAKVDAVMFPHLNFGQEEVVAKVAKELGKPVLIWGPRDPNPEADGTKSGPRAFDTQCGMFATTRALNRFGIPFTYIENCWTDSPVLEQGIDDFVRVVSVVKAFRGMRVAQIGTRPRQFLSVKINESELMRKFGIEVVTIWPEEVVQMVKKLKVGAKPSPLGAELAFGPVSIPETGEPDPRVKEIVDEIESQLDYSDAGHDKVETIAYVELAIMELAKMQKCQAVAVECWAFTSDKFGIPSCFVLGELFDRGLPAACETDIHAAIGAVMAEAAARYESPAFIADITIRDPEDDNVELLWHCGPFAKSLVKEDVDPAIVDCKGCYEIKHGPLTVVRFDQDNGEYKLLADEGEGTDGPKTNGNYVWFRVKDWVKWEKKLMYGPYIHHVSGVHGHYAHILKEACKYIGPVQHDSVEPVRDI